MSCAESWCECDSCDFILDKSVIAEYKKKDNCGNFIARDGKVVFDTDEKYDTNYDELYIDYDLEFENILKTNFSLVEIYIDADDFQKLKKYLCWCRYGNIIRCGLEDISKILDKKCIKCNTGKIKYCEIETLGSKVISWGHLCYHS